jgi:hypothetical protein
MRDTNRLRHRIVILSAATSRLEDSNVFSLSVSGSKSCGTGHAVQLLAEDRMS